MMFIYTSTKYTHEVHYDVVFTAVLICEPSVDLDDQTKQHNKTQFPTGKHVDRLVNM